MGLNATLSVAGRSLEIFSTAVQVAGENIANAQTPGYIREELVLETSPSYRRGTLLLGTGAQTLGVQQQVDQFLEGRLYAANTGSAAASARESVYKQLEVELRELGEGDLSTALSDFRKSLADLADQPESEALRGIAVQQGAELATDIHSLRVRVDDLRETQSARITALVGEANGLIEEIARLNPKIAEFEGGGALPSDAGAERSQRYAAMNRLAEIMPVRFRENPTGTVDVFSGSEYLILGSTTQQLETFSTVDRGSTVPGVRLSRTGSDVTRLGGELRGVAEGRDDILGGFIDDLDAMSAGLIGEFNRLHTGGEGLVGYQSVLATNRVMDTAAPLNAAGLDFPPTHGSFQLKVQNRQTGLTETTTVAVDLDGIGADTSLDDLRAALDAVGNVTASVDTLGRLQLQAADGYELRFADDTSGVLASLGINTFFQGSDSATIGVNDAVADDARLFAAGLGGGPADGRNVSRMVDAFDQPLASLDGRGVVGHYEHVVADVAQRSAAETSLAEGLGTFRQSLESQRAQFSAVSLDEEAVKMIEFQQSYQSAARVISTVDELMRTLLNL